MTTHQETASDMLDTLCHDRISVTMTPEEIHEVSTKTIFGRRIHPLVHTVRASLIKNEKNEEKISSSNKSSRTPQEWTNRLHFAALGGK